MASEFFLWKFLRSDKLNLFCREGNLWTCGPLLAKTYDDMSLYFGYG